MANIQKVQGLNQKMDKLKLEAENLKQLIKKDEKIIEEKKVELQTLNKDNKKMYNFTLRSDDKRSAIIEETKETINDAKKDIVTKKKKLNKVKKEMNSCEKDASQVNAIVAKYPDI